MEYTGVDLSTEMVRIASERFPDVEISAVGSEGIKFPSRTFDVVCSIAVIHHNPYDEQSSILHKLSRIIKPNGFLVLFEGMGQYDPGSVLEFPRTSADWQKSLQALGLENLWSGRHAILDSTIMNKQ
jgi:ubiquinone/menaquinone biosynthesis C-methylase UbiE